MQIVKLKDISKAISSGLTPSRSNESFWSNGTINWLKTDQLGDRYIYETNEKISEEALKRTSIKLFPAGTLSIAMYGEGRTRGNVSILKSEMTTNQACCNIVLDSSKAVSEFVYYFLKTQYGNLRSLSSGVRKNLNSGDIKEFKIKLFELPTQQNIASILSAFDDKIELNNRINAELEQMAKTLYDYWFVQFDFPDKDGKPYKSSGGQMVYNEVLKREIPEGWKVKKLGEVSSELVRGISPKYTDDSGIPVINQRCIRNNTIDFSFSRRHDTQVRPVRKLIELGDILVNSTGVGTLGRVALVKRLENPQTTVDSHVTIVRADIDRINPVFLGISLLNKQPEIEMLGEGSTGQTELSRINLGKLKLLLPKPQMQNEFGLIVKPLFRKIAINERQNQELSALRDWLLPMLMNGQVKVGNCYPGEQQGELSVAAEPKAAYDKAMPTNYE